MQERAVTHRYVDPLDEIWLRTAHVLGLRVVRDPDVFASTDGKGTLWLAPAGALDEDDCLAQLILHELCHSLVMGPESFVRADWGLDNETDQHRSLEHACLRLQAALLEPLGLREVLAPTTQYRTFYDALERDPFAVSSGTTDDGSAVRARVALGRSRLPPWSPHLGRALEATADVVHAVARATAALGGVDAAQGSEAERPTLCARRTPRARPHPSGFHADPVPGRCCAECGWFTPGPGSERGRCRQMAGRAEASWPSCERFEENLDCLSCGACCREAYDTVLVSRKDPARRQQSALMVVHDSGSAELRRRDGRCVALQGGAPVSPRLASADPDRPELPWHAPSSEPFTCAIYADRPKTCRDFTRGGEHCLLARRRVGLSL